MFTLNRVVPVALVALVACSAPETYRGTDRGAFLPSARVRWAQSRHDPATTGDALQTTALLEMAASHVQGHFQETAGRADYEVQAGHVALAADLSWPRWRLMPLIGLGYTEIEVAEVGRSASDADFGPVVGVEAAFRATSLFEPYVRFTRNDGTESRVDRLEAGLHVLATEAIGVQFAFARQTSQFDEAAFLGAGASARIESEGVHIALVLRF